MIKLGPGIFILLPTLLEDIHSLLYAYLLQFPPSFFTFNFPEVSPFGVNSSRIPPRPPPHPAHTQVSFSFVSEQRQKRWVWEVFIACHLDKSKNLTEYSPQLSVETKHDVAMDTGCLASAPMP